MRLVTTASQLKQCAVDGDRRRDHGLRLGDDGAFRPLDPGLRLPEASLQRSYAAEDHVGHAGGLLVGPAVQLGQLDRRAACWAARSNEIQNSLTAW